jgi:hypothetical protein
VGLCIALAQRRRCRLRRRRLRLSPLGGVATSMRVQDALEQGVEPLPTPSCLRLEGGGRAAERERAADRRTALFLLDEILHGTNSKERTIGARGVVLELVRRGAIGGVSTHDYALVEIAGESDGKVRLVHFSDHVEGDKMVFDYKLKEGVVQSTNAIRLMRAVGIDVPYDEG